VHWKSEYPIENRNYVLFYEYALDRGARWTGFSSHVIIRLNPVPKPQTSDLNEISISKLFSTKSTSATVRATVTDFPQDKEKTEGGI
jgi:hypothetical protein